MSELESLSFEAAYAELESIVTRLDAGDLPLEDSVTPFERGKRLSEYCQRLLDQAELRSTQIGGES